MLADVQLMPVPESHDPTSTPAAISEEQPQLTNNTNE